MDPSSETFMSPLRLPPPTPAKQDLEAQDLRILEQEGTIFHVIAETLKPRVGERFD